jgi:K+/H+ antiporter YhaU regulatory subunit KhtT
MADNTKIRSVILVLIIIISLALAGGVFVLLQQELTKNIQLVTQLEDVKAKQQAAEARVEESKKMITGLEAKIQEAQGRVDALTKDLEKEKAAKQEALQQIGKYKSDFESQKSLRNELEQKLTQANEDYKKAASQLKELGAKRTELESKVKDLEEKIKQQEVSAETDGVELGKIVVNSETGQAILAPGADGTQQATPSGTAVLEGKVLVINKEYNFAVINLGNKDSITVGSTFGVYHDETYLGDVKVEKVHESMSAAGFASVDVKNKISEGDRVVLKSK